MGKQVRESSWTDRVRQVLYWTGIGWLTPFVGTVDNADLEYLRESILRDLEWVETLLIDPANQLPALVQVKRDLAALAGDTPAGTNSRFQPVRFPWHVASGWTDYGAIRVALLSALPASARPAAVAELKRMEPVVLAGSRAGWHTQVTDLEALITSKPADPAIPHTLQALWREVDFGRNHRWIRIAKNTTIMAITWFVVLAATLGTAIALDSARSSSANVDDPTSPDPWVIALLGLLGGSISALRSTNLLGGEERSPIEVEAVKLRLRPVVGAAMAIVVYVLGRSQIAFELVTRTGTEHAAPIQIQVSSVTWGYYALAFLAGFAERWFLQVVDLAGARFNPTTTTVSSTTRTTETNVPPPTDGGAPAGGAPAGGAPAGGAPAGGAPAGGAPAGGAPAGGTPAGGAPAGGAPAGGTPAGGAPAGGAPAGGAPAGGAPAGGAPAGGAPGPTG